MPKEINDFKAKFEYNDEQSMKKCVECKSEANTVSYISYNNKII